MAGAAMVGLAGAAIAGAASLEDRATEDPRAGATEADSRSKQASLAASGTMSWQASTSRNKVLGEAAEATMDRGMAISSPRIRFIGGRFIAKVYRGARRVAIRRLDAVHELSIKASLCHRSRAIRAARRASDLLALYSTSRFPVCGSTAHPNIAAEEMLTDKEAQEFAKHWVEAWSSHNLDEIMSHYAEHVVLVSPVAAKILNDPSGTVNGKKAVHAYFKRGLEAYPSLKFELIDVMRGLSSIVLYYMNQKGTKTGEFMELDADSKVIRVVANYSG